MSYEIFPLTGDICALALWDSTWQSYNNCYLIRRGGHTVLIDSGKREHAPLLLEALAKLGLRPDQIAAFIATHGHHDHTGGSEMLPKTRKWIHSNDLTRLDNEQQSQFMALSGESGELYGLEYVLLGHHTDGSVALFDQASQTLFCGDHVCFFGDTAPHGEFLASGAQLRAQMVKLVAELFGNPRERLEQRLDLFMAGLRTLAGYSAGFLATGHGPVLRDNIGGFLRQLTFV